jgi:hypothetical protein
MARRLVKKHTRLKVRELLKCFIKLNPMIETLGGGSVRLPERFETHCAETEQRRRAKDPGGVSSWLRVYHEPQILRVEEK